MSNTLEVLEREWSEEHYRKLETAYVERAEEVLGLCKRTTNHGSKQIKAVEIREN